MSPRILILIASLSILIVCFSGCTKPYIITDELKAPLSSAANCSIGAIIDELPGEFEESKKPTEENIGKFKDYLSEALAKEEVFFRLWTGNDSIPYEVTGSILDYSKGSGFMRFMFGRWAGSAKVTVSLRLKDKRSNEILFGGNFKGAVTSWAENGDAMFKRVSQDFAKQLKKQIENQEKALQEQKI